MARIEVDEITAPSYWASALINGDFSGLDADEAKWVERWMDRLAERGWAVVDIKRDEEGEAYDRFSGGYRSPDGILIRGGDVVDYVIHRVHKKTPPVGVHRIGARSPRSRGRR